MPEAQKAHRKPSKEYDVEYEEPFICPQKDDADREFAEMVVKTALGTDGQYNLDPMEGRFSLCKRMDGGYFVVAENELDGEEEREEIVLHLLKSGECTIDVDAGETIDDVSISRTTAVELLGGTMDAEAFENAVAKIVEAVKEMERAARELEKERATDFLTSMDSVDAELVPYVLENMGAAEAVVAHGGSLYDLDGIVALGRELGREVSYDEFSKVDESGMFDDMGIFNLGDGKYRAVVEAVLNDKVHNWADLQSNGLTRNEIEGNIYGELDLALYILSETEEKSDIILSAIATLTEAKRSADIQEVISALDKVCPVLESTYGTEDYSITEAEQLVEDFNNDRDRYYDTIEPEYEER